MFQLCLWNTYLSLVVKTVVFPNLYIEILIIGQRSMNQYRNDNLAKYTINVGFVHSSAIFVIKSVYMKCCLETKCEKRQTTLRISIDTSDTRRWRRSAVPMTTSCCWTPGTSSRELFGSCTTRERRRLTS